MSDIHINIILKSAEYIGSLNDWNSVDEEHLTKDEIAEMLPN